MRAITLHQPWASLVALNIKTIETRSWAAPKSLIGQRIAIHAAKRYPVAFEDDQIGDFKIAEDIPLGAVVCTAVLDDCALMVSNDDRDDRPILLVDSRLGLILWQRNRPGWPYEIGADVSAQLPYGDFKKDRWAWLLADVEQLAEPVPATGHQGIWEWTP